VLRTLQKLNRHSRHRVARFSVRPLPAFVLGHINVNLSGNMFLIELNGLLNFA
jgi:hypothetical protein